MEKVFKGEDLSLKMEPSEVGRKKNILAKSHQVPGPARTSPQSQRDFLHKGDVCEKLAAGLKMKPSSGSKVTESTVSTNVPTSSFLFFFFGVCEVLMWNKVAAAAAAASSRSSQGGHP